MVAYWLQPYVYPTLNNYTPLYRRQLRLPSARAQFTMEEVLSLLTSYARGTTHSLVSRIGQLGRGRSRPVGPLPSMNLAVPLLGQVAKEPVYTVTPAALAARS